MILYKVNIPVTLCPSGEAISVRREVIFFVTYLQLNPKILKDITTTKRVKVCVYFFVACNKLFSFYIQ